VLGLVDMDVVEVHPWNAVVDDIEEADTMVFDLDPGRGISWPFVIDAALTLREILAQEGFERSWPKLTGGKGIMVPLSERISHDQAHQRNKELAARLLEVDAQRFTISAVLGARRGRLFLDYLRNGRGTTAIGTYLPRARPGCPIAAPVPWSEIENGIAPDAYNMHLLPVSPRGLYHGTGR
jgi:bifunctional non-homologous end joining protein LigD